MSTAKPLSLILVMFVGICVLLAGCGKKAQTKEPGIPEVQRPPQSEIDTFLSKQTIGCEGTQVCPNYLAKIVIVFGNQYKFCTGYLVDEETVGTSASCLPNLLRLAGQDCEGDVYFFFPKTSNRPMEQVGCKSVALSSQLEGQDPILWRDDVAFLTLQKKISFRRQAQILRDGLQNSKQYSVWMLDQQDNFSGIIRKGNCEIVHSSYVNPLAINESSPNIIFADCPVTRGGGGAPLTDLRGKIRGMISQDIDPKLKTYLESTGLLLQPLRPLTHGTNFGCAPTPFDNDMLDERECLKDMSYTRVDRARAEMLSTNFLFGDLRKKFEESLAGISKYVRFAVKLIPKGDVQQTEIYPKCFKLLSDWLPTMNTNRNVYVDEVMLPNPSFKRGMDSVSKVIGTVIEAPEKSTFVQFSLKTLRSTKKSSILLWTAAEINNVTTYQNITEECGPLLF
jgi:hypothetical protein